MPAQSAPKTVLEAPPVDTSSMPDSISRLIQNIFSLIDSLEVKDSTRIDIHVDTTRLVKDTIFIMTEFVEDSIMAQELLQQLDSIVEKKVVADIPIQKTDSTLAKPHAKDTLRKIPPKPQPLKMCAQAQAILQEAKINLQLYRHARYRSIRSSCLLFSTGNDPEILRHYMKTFLKKNMFLIPSADEKTA